MKKVEVFKTNITLPKDAKRIVKALVNAGKGNKVNLDLEDCDKILRIQNSNGKDINIEQVVNIVKEADFKIEILEG
jgi:hypothetical protein